MSKDRSPPLLCVRNLSVRFDGRSVVDGLDLQLERGRTLALAGESGCGKSSTAMALMGLLPTNATCSGQVLLQGQALLTLQPRQWDAVRGLKIGMIFQEPMTSLNPVYRVGQQVLECLERHLDLDPDVARARVLALLERVQLRNPSRVYQAYPHELSGGQRQRIMIAMAIACEPSLLIADEPTTALDATVQQQILQLLRSLCQELGMGLLLISHDLPVIARWADDLVVMHHGQAIERLPAAKLYSQAAHPYTQGLINASMRVDSDVHYRRVRLPEIDVSQDPQTGEYYFQTHITPAPSLSKRPAKPPLLAVRDLAVRYRQSSPDIISQINLAIAPGMTLAWSVSRAAENRRSAGHSWGWSSPAAVTSDSTAKTLAEGAATVPRRLTVGCAWSSRTPTLHSTRASTSPTCSTLPSRWTECGTVRSANVGSVPSSTPWACRHAVLSASLTSSLEGNASESRSPEHWSPAPSWWSATSPCRRWMCRCAHRSSTC